MSSLCFVDEHARSVAASPEATYAVLLAWVESHLLVPAPKIFAALWHLDSPSGFTIAERVEPQRVVLRGQHRFARYELAFEVDASGPSTKIYARTRAAFPGALGKLYRAAVIGTGGHAVVVRDMLRRIARLTGR